MNFLEPAVKEKFAKFPPPYRKKLLEVRELIFSVAEEHNQKIAKIAQTKIKPKILPLLLPKIVIQETLKWGEPAYLPVHKKIGTMVRLHWSPKKPHQCGVYFLCQTSLVKTFRKMFGEHSTDFHYEGNRGLIFKTTDPLSAKTKAQLKECILIAFTYYLNISSY